MLKFCTNTRIWALLLRKVCFFWGGKGAFRPKKGCNAPSAGYGFPGKKAVFWGGGERGRFSQKKGCNAPSVGYRFPRKKILRKLNTYCKLLYMRYVFQ